MLAPKQLTAALQQETYVAVFWRKQKISPCAIKNCNLITNQRGRKKGFKQKCWGFLSKRLNVNDELGSECPDVIRESVCPLNQEILETEKGKTFGPLLCPEMFTITLVLHNNK